MPCEYKEMTKPGSGQRMPRLDLLPGVPPLTSLYLYISNSCNLACRHCWINPEYQKNANNGQHLKLTYVRKAIEESKPLGLKSVKLTGGEPTLHPKFRELITLLNKEKLSIVIETNGILIDRELAKFLKSNSGVTFISVSLDGALAETNDALRGIPGSYERTMEGIRNLVKVGFHPQIICTLHKSNIGEVDDIVKLADRQGCGSIKFNLVQQMGRGESFAKKHGLDVYDIIQHYRRIEKELMPKSNIRIYFDIPFAFHSINRLLNGSSGRCSVLNILGILAGGELSLCGIGETVPEFVFGHIEDDKLREVWYDSPHLVRLREQIPGQLEGICARCLHRDMCLGTCVANNFYSTGKINAAFTFCEHSEAKGLFPASRKR